MASETDFKKERVLLPSNLVPTHYNLEITPDFDKFEFDGKQEVNLYLRVGCLSALSFN